MTVGLESVLEQLKQMGATPSELESVRRATISIQQSEGIIARTITGPVAIGRGARAVQNPKPAQGARSGREPKSAATAKAPQQPSPKFWGSAMELAKSAGSVAEAVAKIVTLAKGLGV